MSDRASLHATVTPCFLVTTALACHQRNLARDHGCVITILRRVAASWLCYAMGRYLRAMPDGRRAFDNIVRLYRSQSFRQPPVLYIALLSTVPRDSAQIELR